MILGAGIGGIVAATLLRRRLPRNHRVVLVEREGTHVFPPSLLWVLTGAREPRSVSRPLAALARRGIELVQGEVERISPETRSARVAGREVVGDYLVIALGAELAPAAIPGLAESGHNLYTLEGVLALRAALRQLRQGHLAVLVAGTPFKCPAAPYEAAMLLEAELRRRGVRERVALDLYTPEPGPMPVAGPVVSAGVRAMVEAKGIRYYPQHAVHSLDPAARLIRFANGGNSAPFDLLAYVPPHRAPSVVRESGLVGESGWIPVDRNTLETKHAGVYAIGDVAGIPLAGGKALPKAGVFAHGEAAVVAHNIARAARGELAASRFDGYGECFVEVGDGRAGYGSGNFYAEPAPDIRLRPPSRLRHFGKVLFEQYWLRRWL